MLSCVVESRACAADLHVIHRGKVVLHGCRAERLVLRLRPRRKKVRTRLLPSHYVYAARCGHRQPDRRLRGCSACSNGAVQGVRWTDDTVDNEDMGKKKSKSELLSCAMFVRQYCIARILDQSKRSLLSNREHVAQCTT